MHDSVLRFITRVLGVENVRGRTVVEVGAGNINGSVRPYIDTLKPGYYIGVDASEGIGVDIVTDCERLSESIAACDVLISTEMLEHVRDWRVCVREMAKVVAPGGTLVWTTRSPGFHYHPYPEDHWRYTLGDMRKILYALGLGIVILEDDPDEAGVFVMARKPLNWTPDVEALNTIEPQHVQRYPVRVKDPDEPSKLVVAFPLYHGQSDEFFMNWLQMDKTYLAGHSAVRGSMGLPQKMESLVAKAFEVVPDLDRIVVMENDMIPPLDAFNRIAAYGDEYDIVGSTYFKHEPPHHVMAWMQVDKPRFSPLTREMVKMMVDSPGLYQVDGVAMGFTSISRRVFEKWDEKIPMWTPTPPMVGHDLHFCNEARKQGFKICLDSGLGCGHLTLMPIGYPHSQEALAINEPRTWAQAMEHGDTPVLERAL